MAASSQAQPNHFLPLRGTGAVLFQLSHGTIRKMVPSCQVDGKRKIENSRLQYPTGRLAPLSDERAGVQGVPSDAAV